MDSSWVKRSTRQDKRSDVFLGGIRGRRRERGEREEGDVFFSSSSVLFVFSSRYFYAWYLV